MEFTMEFTANFKFKSHHRCSVNEGTHNLGDFDLISCLYTSDRKIRTEIRKPLTEIKPSGSDSLDYDKVAPIGDDMRELMGLFYFLSKLSHLLTPSFLCYRLDCFAAFNTALLKFRNQSARLPLTVDYAADMRRREIKLPCKLAIAHSLFSAQIRFSGNSTIIFHYCFFRL